MSTKNFCTLACVCLVAVFATAGSAQPKQKPVPTSRYVKGVPFFMVLPAASTSQNGLRAAAAAANIPMWSSSFTFQGSTFNYTMIGTNPASGSATTQVPVVIIPIRYTFSNGTSLSANSTVCGDTQTAVQRVQNSPIFQNATYSPGGTTVGTTQYPDAYQRANFWSSVSTTSPNYHVTLSFTTAALQTISVPRRSGTTVAGPCARIGEVDINFFDSRAHTIITNLGLPATSLPLFVSYNTFLTSGGSCCILGYHSATSSNHTYAVAAYSDPNIFSVPIQDVHALSHEIGEWMDDPFGNNLVPAWGHVGQVSGCQNNLENGDPVTGIAFTVTMGGFTYHPEDLVFLPWFSRQTPSSSVNGWFTFLNTFSAPQAVCH